MADARTARPVSGEIMTGIAMDPTRFAPGGAGDIIDAEFEELSHRAEQQRPPAPPIAQAPAVEGMDMLRRADCAPIQPIRGGPIFWIAGAAAILAAFWTSGGHALMRQTTLFSAERPARDMFSISGVSSRVDASGERPVLFVEGGAANDGPRVSPLPSLAIKVTGNDNLVTRYTLGTAGQPLAPGERFAFSSRLEVPKNGVKTISVVFAE